MDSSLFPQRMFKGTKSVEEYFIEMELKLIRAQLVESQEAIMVRFLNGLNRDIQYIVELCEYTLCTKPQELNSNLRGMEKELTLL
ncbi:hypothetical protein CR513_45510, partial [Mucuna pruriens]